MNFREIIKYNSKNVKNIIKKITNEYNEDLEQEVYLKVYKNSDKYKEKNFTSWINTIARNVSIDYLKSSFFKNKLKTVRDDFILENTIDNKITPENKLIGTERGKRVLEEVKKLKPKLREVIICVEFYNMSYEECSKKLKCPIGTVKSRIYSAKKELAQKLEDLL